MAQPQQRPAQGVVRFYNFLPESASFLGEVLAGLARAQKTLPSKYFYDAHGCGLLEKICESSDDSPARIELSLLREHAAAMALFLGPDCQLIELGGGATRKTSVLIGQLQPSLYVPVGISAGVMQMAAAGLAQDFPWLNITGVCADYTGPLALPSFVGVPIRKKVVYLPGAIFGIFTPHEAAGLLRLARRLVGPGGALLAGVELKPDRAAAESACSDASGAAAAFNLNLLERINRALGGDFQLRRFRHRAAYHEGQGWTEMHVESLASQFVHVGGTRFGFGQGETVLTAISCTHGADAFRALAQRAGFAPGQTWSDAASRFSVHGMIAV